MSDHLKIYIERIGPPRKATAYTIHLDIPPDDQRNVIYNSDNVPPEKLASVARLCETHLGKPQQELLRKVRRALA